MKPIFALIAAQQICRLPEAQQRKEINTAVTLMQISKYDAPTEIWIKGLGED